MHTNTVSQYSGVRVLSSASRQTRLPLPQLGSSMPPIAFLTISLVFGAYATCLGRVVDVSSTSRPPARPRAPCGPRTAPPGRRASRRPRAPCGSSPSAAGSGPCAARPSSCRCRARLQEGSERLARRVREGCEVSPCRAGEAHVQRRDRRLEPQLEPHLVHNQQRRDLAHALLDRLQADQVVVELLEDVLDALLVHEVVDGARRDVVGDLPHQRDLALLWGMSRTCPGHVPDGWSCRFIRAVSRSFASRASCAAFSRAKISSSSSLLSTSAYPPDQPRSDQPR